MGKTKAKWLPTLISGVVGGTVYAVLMALFYKFFSDEVFNVKKFAVDFLMFAAIIAVFTWFNLRKKK